MESPHDLELVEKDEARKTIARLKYRLQNDRKRIISDIMGACAQCGPLVSAINTTRVQQQDPDYKSTNRVKRFRQKRLMI